MTSPRQRKKRLAAFKLKQKREEELLKQKTVVSESQVEIKQEEPVKLVEVPAVTVVESEAKPKKTKNALVETKSQEQVVEQLKAEVKTETKE
jgi:hypothetical protein